MICLKCNTPNPDASRFCSQCGIFMTIVPTQASSQQEEAPTVAPGTGGFPPSTGFRAQDSMAATTASAMGATSPGLIYAKNVQDNIPGHTLRAIKEEIENA